MYGFRILICLALLIGVGGCHRYQSKPLDLVAHQQEWAARDASGSDIAAFAAQLAGDSSTSEFRPADGLSLAEAEVVALFFNPDLRAARQRAQVTAANAKFAGLWDDPVFDIDVLRIVESVPDPWIIGSSLSFTIPISGRLGAEKSLAAAEHKVELARVALREWEVVTELRSKWIEWSAIRLRADVAAEVGTNIQRALSAVEKLEHVGELSPFKARLFRIESVTRDSEARVLHGRAAELEIALRSLLGLVPDAPVDLQPTVAASAADTPSSQDTSILAERNPALAVLKLEYEASEQALRREIRKQYPDLGIGPAYGNEDDQSRIGFVGSLPIPLLNRNQQGIAVSEAQREVARAEFEAQFEHLVHRLAQTHAQFKYLHEVRQQLETELIPLVEQQARDAQRLMDLGEFDVFVQLESLQRLLDAKLQLIDAREAEADASNSLHALLGFQPARTQTSTQGSNP